MPESPDPAEWRELMIPQYMNCAVAHNQCRKALIERSNKQ